VRDRGPLPEDRRQGIGRKTQAEEEESELTLARQSRNQSEEEG
jgi:hypothetical protein